MATASQEAKEVSKKLQGLLKQYDRKTRRKIYRKAAKPVVKSAKNNAPVGTPKRGSIYGGAVSLRYDTPKLTSKIRAPKGKGRIKARYFPRNLSKAIRVLIFRTASFIYVGPKYRRTNTSGDFGKGSRVDGYYAHMLYGSAKEFFKRVMAPAARANQKAVETTIGKEVLKIADTYAKRKKIQ